MIEFIRKHAVKIAAAIIAGTATIVGSVVTLDDGRAFDLSVYGGLTPEAEADLLDAGVPSSVVTALKAEVIADPRGVACEEQWFAAVRASTAAKANARLRSMGWEGDTFSTPVGVGGQPPVVGYATQACVTRAQRQAVAAVLAASDAQEVHRRCDRENLPTPGPNECGLAGLNAWLGGFGGRAVIPVDLLP